MISKKFKFIFSHIPKCAGESVLSTLHKIDHTISVDPINKKSHTTFSRYMMLHPAEFNSYYKFCFVRNPFDRCVSLYHYRKKHHNRAKVNPHWPTAQELVKNNFKQMVMKHVENKHQKTQYLEAGFLDGHWLDVEMLKLVDYVGRFESLQQDFDTICDQIGIARHELPHMNRTDHKHYTEYYDDETKQIVAERYARDIEFFGYEFGQ